MILPPTSQISHHHKVTNITMSPTSLSPSQCENMESGNLGRLGCRRPEEAWLRIAFGPFETWSIMDQFGQLGPILEQFLENKIISSGGFRVKSHSFITIYSFHNYINEPGTFQIKLIILYSKYDFIIILIVYYYHIILLL